MPPAIDSPLFLLPNTFRAFYGAFPCLYSIQERAIRPVLDSRDLIIQSATGSGKTEAVLAPCVERIIRCGWTESALYVVPTRALAFDIRRRFESSLNERLGLRFAIRTGDIKRVGGGCPHIMLTTPESLDVMLGSSNADLRGFLSRVRTIIIDEVHPYIHQCRGRQLVYLLQRLERRTGGQVQKIVLSATIADPDVVIQFFNFRADAVILRENVSRRILPRLIHLKDDDRELVALLDDLYREWDYRKILVFANSRGRCDKIFGIVNRQGRFMCMAELHYSNLNAKERQIVERRFRQRSRSVCIATSTLELGIDVGDVDAVILFEPPDSVAAFLQRIGRANRRQNTIHFWGICRGEQAGKQMLRFLALLGLARQGKVESPLPKSLPSVLSQQVISCLYEKKRISPTALEDLFSTRDGADDSLPLKDIFHSLVEKNWLKETSITGLYTAGRRYRDALLMHGIWSNFPESEEEYRLEVSGESVADIPKSVVRQLEPGDRILLAGRRLRILRIDERECKRVSAEPTDRLDEKELYWLGPGCHVSFEVAQAMRDVLKSAKSGENEADSGLFSRTRTLLQEELQKGQKAVVLDNTIEVIISADGFYHYRTFLGTVGNMILEWSVRENLGKHTEDFHVASDEIGLICSHWVQFEELSLPLAQKDFLAWIRGHYKIMRAMFPLNAFCATLSRELILRELTGFIYDNRLVAFFEQYLSRSSEIVRGDPADLTFQPRYTEKKVAAFLDASCHWRPLLTWEKERCPTDAPFPVAEAGRYMTRPLTGTIIGEYFRRGQCCRWFGFHFLRPEHKPPRHTRVDDEQAILRMERGRDFERRVLADLEKQGESLVIIPERDTDGKIRPIEVRFEETLARLQRPAGQDSLTGNLYLSQGVLIIDAVLSPSPAFFCGQNGRDISLAGVGIPDLIRMISENETSLLEVGDIKSSFVPHYHQKWQVAFYAFLLNSLMHSKKGALQAKVADQGFLFIPSPLNGAPQCHSFDLRPYLTTFAAIFRNLNVCLSDSPFNAFWQLRNHCTDCAYFKFCYQQALTGEDVQFLPRLTRGALQKMRSLGLKSLDEALAWFTASGKEKGSGTGRPDSSCRNTPFGPSQKERLHAAIHALVHNRIGVAKKKSDLFPANISTAFFVHLVHHPVSMQPYGLGLGIRKRGESPVTMTWTVFTDTDRRRAWRDFSNRLLELWDNSVGNGMGPHIFFFGADVRQRMREWAAIMEDTDGGGLFSHGPDAYCTDLRQTLQEHFFLPIPGNTTLFALSRILGLTDGPETPDSLFHGDRLPDAAIMAENRKGSLATCLEAIIKLEETTQQWISSHLESEWNREEWRIIPRGRVSRAEAYQRFIQAERSYRQTDIMTLQALSLEERVERFRALGPLRYTGTVLDEEGRFLYMFTIADGVGLAKFRPGDFLRLTPLGVTDLQSGMPVIMALYAPQAGQVALHSRQGHNMRLHKGLSYSLEEDADDRNTARLLNVVQTVYSANVHHPMADLFDGAWDFEQPHGWQEWVREWLRSEAAAGRLNPSQQNALELPFRYALGLIQGPPGTGKTNLLGWILIALIRHAHTTGGELRIAVCGLTHQAIDQVLLRVTNLVNTLGLKDFPARCVKLGRWDGPEFDEKTEKLQVEPLVEAGNVLLSPYLILGSTGYGLHNIFRNHNNSGPSPKPFDWVIFDEASQLLLPQALLSLVYGKGNFLFLGDMRQLPPVVLSATYEGESLGEPLDDESIETEARRSVLDILLRRYPSHSARLDVTYRMNAEICMFPSQTWYDSALCPAPANAQARLFLKGLAGNDLLDKIIDPQKPVVLVLADHHGCCHESAVETEIISRLACRLLLGYGMDKEELAIISPHRAQNNAIARRLSGLLAGISRKDRSETVEACHLDPLAGFCKSCSGNTAPDLPLIDTVERMQGAERDVVLFGFTSSDPDHVLSEFLNNPNRFNVAITRARKKLVVVGSMAFFSAIPHTEKQLRANACFKAFLEYCRGNACCFEFASDVLGINHRRTGKKLTYTANGIS
jgi:superfamily II DNA/RNA helicase